MDTPGEDPGARSPRTKGNVDAALASAAHDGVGDVQAPLPGPHADRPELRGRGRPDGATGRDDLEQHPERREPRHRPDERPLAAPAPNQIRVIFYEGSGSFGNGCVAFDTAESAAIMSKAVGEPVRLQMMRWDEHGWTHYGPAIMYDMRAGVDANGQHRRVRGDRLRPGRHVACTPRPSSRSGSKPPAPRDAARRTTENLAPYGQGRRWTTMSNIGLPGDQQADHADARHLPDAAAARAAGAADGVRSRADHGHAGGLAGMDSLAFRLQNMRTDLGSSAALGGGAAGSGRRRVGWKP